MPDLNSFLQKIAQIESSGGKNTNHPMVTHGVNAGNSAIGRYGLMPNTIREIVNRARIHGTLTPEMKNLYNASDDDINNAITNNPQLENQLAQHYANTLNQMKNGNEQAMAYAWNNGEHSNPTQDQLQSNPYVQKFNALEPQRNIAALPSNFPSLFETQPLNQNTNLNDPNKQANLDGLEQLYQKYKNLVTK